MLLATLILAQAQTKAPSCCDPMAAFASDPKFALAHPKPKMLRFQATTGKDVTFPAKDGTPAKGFYVPGRKAALVMCPEYWGLNDYIKREAERYHKATGYAVLAVDLYDGKIATDAQTAGQYMKEADPARDTAIVSGAVAALEKGSLGAKYAKLGTIGWCFGGGWSLNTAVAGGSAVKASVAYYGMPPQDVTPIKAPVLFVWATQDGWINRDVVSGFKSRMAAEKKPLTVLPYDAAHAFANPSNPKYDATAAKSANAKTLAFLKSKLG